MTRPKPPTKKPAAHATSGRTKAKRANGASASEDFGELIDLIADAKERGVLDPKNRLRFVAKPSATNTASAPFARIVAGAKTEDQQLRALAAAARTEVALPADALVVGEPVTAVDIMYSGHPRAGLTLYGTRGSRVFSVGLADVVFPHGSDGARFVSLYRGWLGFGELPSELELPVAAHVGLHWSANDEITVGSPVELIVLACKSNAVRCRVLGTAREVTLRTAGRDEVPGGIIAVMPTKWTQARHALAGNVLSMRADVEALGLVRLAVQPRGQWNPKTEYWGEEGEPVEECAKPIVARGPRPMFEMEQVIQRADSDAILEASERNAAGDRARAREILMNLLARDLRSLDAHAHLGNFEFDHRPAQALRHYEVGLSIGAFSLGTKFDGVLPWGFIDNRPFLRCLHGVGLCWWRLGKTREAAAAFRKMLWLNPGDNQGARFNLAAVEAGKTWEEMEGDER